MSKTIFIAGAGIAGLTCALSLARYGLSSTILEAFEKPHEVGAGIQIPPNSWRVLKALGLEEALKDAVIMPESIRLTDAHTGKVALDLPVNADKNSDMHFGVIHRAKLHALLWKAAQESDLISIKTDHAVEKVIETADGLEIEATTKTGSETYHADVLIGADGIWSNTRRFVPGANLPKATGRIALRAIVPANNQPANTVTAWMAREAHIVTYPVRNKDTLNVVAIINGAAHEARWDSHFDGPLPGDLRDALKQFCSTDIDDIAFTRWPLFSIKPGGKWYSKHICLIGDAAHGMEPFAAQGAAMGVEDAFELAYYLRTLEQKPAQQLFAEFESHRAKRVAKVVKRTELNRIAYHQAGLGRWGRNFIFAAQPSQKFLDSLNWLYGYKAKGI